MPGSKGGNDFETRWTLTSLPLPSCADKDVSFLPDVCGCDPLVPQETASDICPPWGDDSEALFSHPACDDALVRQ